MIYDDYFWTELTYEKHSFVAPSGEVLIHVNYYASNRTYRVAAKDFLTLGAAKVFAVALLKRTGKIPDDDPTDPPEEETT